MTVCVNLTAPLNRSTSYTYKYTLIHIIGGGEECNLLRVVGHFFPLHQQMIALMAMSFRPYPTPTSLIATGTFLFNLKQVFFL